ncbi:MAG TPA: sugar phosphate nucleotidyltransferase [Candidatus Saccharimonadales bacterium]|jgi:UTP--glucose-1-phosphate uridylyltransferase|nr:sugar phosphate nucleotidyltransferase [Candidatus Saccharimonadales bacterium]
MKQLTKAVIAAAGFGTRFLPQTKAMPKEMLPIVDKPIIQYLVEELVEAGIKDIIIVTGYSKRSIEDHFDTPNEDLLANLRAGGEKKAPLVEQVEAIADLANFVYVRQKGVYGSATPLMNVRHLIGDEPFIYTYADDFIVAEPSRFTQMVNLYKELDGPVFSCMRIKDEADFKRYGVVAGEPVRDGVLKMTTIIEKPGRENAPSDLASVSSYLLTPDIFEYLERSSKELKQGEEFQVQPAMQQMMQEGKACYACEIKNGRYCDTGDKLEYVKTVVDFALKRQDIGPAFEAYLKERICK